MLAEPLPKRRKLKIRLPQWKPPKEPPPRLCRLCGERRDYLDFLSAGHRDVCRWCEADVGRHYYGRGHWNGAAAANDAAVMNAALTVIRHMERESARAEYDHGP